MPFLFGWLALAAWVAVPEGCIPVRWQGGPLEVRRRAVGPESVEIVRNWYQPATLELLAGTPINCLLATWAAGGEPALEQEQQRLVAEYARAAGKRGISVRGIVYPGADPAKAAAAAKAAGLAGIVLERELAEGIAPGVRALSETDVATATPTSEPWIDANGWRVRLLGARRGGPVWLGYGLERASGDDYVRAIAEAAAAGGAWVVGLDDSTMAGVWHKQPKAVSVWRRIGEALAFFAERAEWRQFRPSGPLGILGGESEMYEECLNLIARGRIPYRLIERGALGLEGLKAVLALGPVTAEERRRLEEFARRGGQVLYRDSAVDPEALAKQMPDLLGRANLGVRLFNAASVLPYVSEDGGRLLVQLVNYASAPSEPVTVRVTGDYRAARLYTLGAPAEDLPVDRAEGRSQVRVDSIAIHAGLLWEK